MFTEKFDDYVCDGDSITCEVDGYTVTAKIERDDDCGTPWENSDGHGPVSGWRKLSSKRPSERVLVNCHATNQCRFYDWAEAMKIARRDGWDAPPYDEGTKGQKAERAVQRDFEYLQAWCNDEWWYVSLTLSVSYGGIDLEEYAASLCGIEVNYPGSDHQVYLLEAANELLPEALEVAKKRRAEMLETLAK